MKPHIKKENGFWKCGFRVKEFDEVDGKPYYRWVSFRVGLTVNDACIAWKYK